MNTLVRCQKQSLHPATGSNDRTLCQAIRIMMIVPPPQYQNLFPVMLSLFCKNIEPVVQCAEAAQEEQI